MFRAGLKTLCSDENDPLDARQLHIRYMYMYIFCISIPDSVLLSLFMSNNGDVCTFVLERIHETGLNKK